ncbi:MAG: Fic family protein [Gammaproteobacteria bacterium]|nr:Fic family protein [Gammaproteobacteria bacterium]
MHSLEEMFLAGLTFDATEVATLRHLGEYHGKQALYFQRSPEVLETLRRVATIESTESSPRIEGIVIPHRRVEDLVLRSAAPGNRSEQEVAGYRDALQLIHQSGRDIPFSINVVLQLHSIMYRYLPMPGGGWKQTNNDIVEKNADGSIRRVPFSPTPAHLTAAAMADLVSRYDAAIERRLQDPLVIVPLTVFDFLCIHPFTDGNGRIARLLTLLLLYHYDYQVGRYISIERVYEETRDTYYESLEASSQHWHESRHQVHPWLNYFWGMLLHAYAEFEERIGTIRTGRGSKTVRVREAVTRRIGPFSISDIEADCPGISRDMIRNVLRQMRDESFIVSVGKGRGAKWVKAEGAVH